MDLIQAAKKIVKYTGFDFTAPNCTIMDSHRNYKTLEEYAFDKRIKDHLLGKYTVCLSRFSQSKIYCIDIDHHDENVQKAKETVLEVIKCIGIPFYIERSKFSTGGYHLYFKFKEYLFSKIWVNLPAWFEKNYQLKIETITGLKKFKLPFSRQYPYFGKFNSLDPSLVSSVSLEEGIQLFETAQPIEFPKCLESIQFFNQISECVCAVKDNNNDLNKNWQSFQYSAGERTNTQFKLAVRSVFWGISFESYVENCYASNIGSKDMQNWSSSQILNDLKLKWNKAQKIVKLNPTNNYNQQKNYVFYSNNFDKCISREEEFKLKVYLETLYLGRKGKTKERFIRDCVTFYKIVTSSLEYRKRKNFRYNNEFSFLNGGVPLSQSLRKRIGKQFRIQNHQKVYSFLVRTNVITLIRDKNGYSYSYKIKKWVQHFLVNKLLLIKNNIRDFLLMNLMYLFGNISKTTYNTVYREFLIQKRVT